MKWTNFARNVYIYLLKLRQQSVYSIVDKSRQEFLISSNVRKMIQLGFGGLLVSNHKTYFPFKGQEGEGYSMDLFLEA